MSRSVTRSNSRFSMRILIYQENILVMRAKNMREFLFFLSLFLSISLFFYFFLLFFAQLTLSREEKRKIPKAIPRVVLSVVSYNETA